MSNRKVYLALYKGKKEGRGLKVRWARFRDWLVRTVTRSPYSHCEIAVTVHPKTLYTCYSASARDGGVRRLIAQHLDGFGKKQRIPDNLKRVIIQDIERFDGSKCHVVVSSWFLFSGRQASSWQQLYKAEWYYKLPLSDYPVADDYLNGLEITRQSYIDLIPQFSDNPQALLVLDPPYLSTMQAAYAQANRFGLVDYLKLVSLTRPPYLFFSSTRSEFIDYINTIVSMRLDNWQTFDQATRLTVQAKLSKDVSYEDNLVYKF